MHCARFGTQCKRKGMADFSDKSLRYPGEELAKGTVIAELFFDGSHGMQYGAMVAPAECCADILEGAGGMAPCQEHGNLAGVGNGGCAPPPVDVIHPQTEFMSHALLDIGNGDTGGGSLAHEVCQVFAQESDGGTAVAE